jgi:hypothetical protein
MYGRGHRVVELAGDMVEGVAVASQELLDGVPERKRVDGPASGARRAVRFVVEQH